MSYYLNILPEHDSGGSPPPPPGSPPPGGSGVAIRAQGLQSLVLGFSFGITLMILLVILRLWPNAFPTIFSNMGFFESAMAAFFTGFIGGSLTGIIYNLFVARRLNLFGLEDSAD